MCIMCQIMQLHEIITQKKRKLQKLLITFVTLLKNHVALELSK